MCMLEATSTGKGCGNETRLDGSRTARPKFAHSCGSVEHCRRSVCEKCGFVFNSKDSKRGRKTGPMKLSKSVTYTASDRQIEFSMHNTEASVPLALQIL